jgi:hypothetical protein
VAVFEAGSLAGAAGAGVAADFVGGVAEVAGVAAGVVVFDFAGVAAGVASAGAVAAVAADVADFFERDFFGVVELSAVAVLSVAAAFFDVVFFFVDAVAESGAACELEAPASAFFFFLLLVVALELV